MIAGPALLVDLGNSRVKWALLAAGARSAAGAAAYGGAGVAAARAAWTELPRPRRVLAASVAGAEREDELRSLCEGLWCCTPRFATAGARAAGVTSGYVAPERLGIDRWLALLAVHADRRGAACVVDCGTAVTIDLIDDAGCHQGGLILPGLQLMRECLLARTRIPPFAAPPPRPDLGRDTAAGVVNGVLLAVLGAVRETLALAAARAGRRPRLVVAGGDGAVLAAAWNEPVDLRPDLVLEGLAVLAGSEET